MKKIIIQTEYIALGQFLKLAEIIQSGGEAKWFLSENEIVINGEIDNRRGRKLRNNDQIKINGFGSFIVKNES